jgi:hypothetical protein
VESCKLRYFNSSEFFDQDGLGHGSGLYLVTRMTGLPPSEFSLTSPGTRIPGQVRFSYCAPIRAFSLAYAWRYSSSARNMSASIFARTDSTSGSSRL